MNQDKWKECQSKLAEPFPAAIIGWKPSATNRDNTSALGGAYITPRDVSDRLNEVVGLDWSEEYNLTIGAKSVIVECRLTIMGATRVDIGTQELSDNPVASNVFTSAYAQAFKRAAVKFGLGAYLYRLPKKWVDYDSQKRKFTNQGLAALNGVYLQHVKKMQDSPKETPELPTPEPPAPKETTGHHPPTLRTVSEPEPDSDEIDWAMTYMTSKGTLYSDLAIENFDWLIRKAKVEPIKAANIALDHKLAIGGFKVDELQALIDGTWPALLTDERKALAHARIGELIDAQNGASEDLDETL